MNLTCMLATEADLPRIVAFNREAAGTEISEGYWRWKYFRNPAGPSGVVLACEGDRVVGLMAAFAVPITVDGRDYVAIQMGHNDLLKEYRSSGAYFELSSLVVTELVMRGHVDFCFGVAIAETRDLSTVLMGFEDTGTIHKFVRLFNPLAPLRKHARLPLPRLLGQPVRTVARRLSARRLRGLRVSNVEHFGEPYELAWKRYRSPRILTTRNAAYLEWRYRQCPLSKYSVRQLSDGDTLLGWVAYHRFDEDGVNHGVLDECFSYAEDAASLQRVVDLGISSILEEDVDEIVAWAAPGTPLVTALRANLFLQRPAPRSLIVRRLDTPLTDEFLARAENWYYTVGDSEYWLFPVSGAGV